MSDNVHDSEDFINVFLALAILQWTAGDTQLLLTDLHPPLLDSYISHPPSTISTSLYYLH